MKSAPDHSSVYVISKGKILGARPAIRPMVNMVTPPSENGIRCHTMKFYQYLSDFHAYPMMKYTIICQKIGCVLKTWNNYTVLYIVSVLS